jgi:D-alanyl-D-alanine carboxypeptidase
VILLDIPRLFERPRHLVLAFMAGLSIANRISARLYVDALEAMLPDGAGAEA